MNFTCNDIITGYTAALREQSGDQDPLIQVWRKNTTQLGSYYKTGAGIAISETLCVGGQLTNISGREVFHCSLNQSTIEVAVQPGDILGLELPGVTEVDGMLTFAEVSKGPANCIFATQALSSASLSSCDSVNWELPQIILEIGSGKYIDNHYHNYGYTVAIS